MDSTQVIQDIRDRLAGPVTSVPVTFTADGEVNWDGVCNTIEAGIAGGSNVSLLTYGDGQFDLLSDAEHARLTRTLIEQSAGRSLTVAANRRWPLRKRIEYAEFCRDLGVDLLMCCQPDVMLVARPDMDVAGYYKALADVMPVMLVGWPEFPVLDQLVDHPRICTFKHDGTIDYGLKACRRYGDRFAAMTGGGLGLHYAFWPYGCRAFMSIWPALKPEMDRRYWQAVQAGDSETAVEMLRRDWALLAR